MNSLKKQVYMEQRLFSHSFHCIVLSWNSAIKGKKKKKEKNNKNTQKVYILPAENHIFFILVKKKWRLRHLIKCDCHSYGCDRRPLLVSWYAYSFHSLCRFHSHLSPRRSPVVHQWQLKPLA